MRIEFYLDSEPSLCDFWLSFLIIHSSVKKKKFGWWYKPCLSNCKWDNIYNKQTNTIIINSKLNFWTSLLHSRFYNDRVSKSFYWSGTSVPLRKIRILSSALLPKSNVWITITIKWYLKAISSVKPPIWNYQVH